MSKEAINLKKDDKNQRIEQKKPVLTRNIDKNVKALLVTSYNVCKGAKQFKMNATGMKILRVHGTY